MSAKLLFLLNELFYIKSTHGFTLFFKELYGTKYSRMDQVKFEEESP